MATARIASHRKLGTFSLAMLSISAIIALQSLPSLAKNGLSVITILLLGIVLFFLPICLACAELASGWPKSGGIYAWVKEAFGDTIGTLAVWLEWFGGGVIWLPTILSFISANIAYGIDSSLAGNKPFMYTIMLVILWSCTLINVLSLKTSNWLSALGTTVGSLLPGIAIIIFGCIWLKSQQPTQLTWHIQDVFPVFSANSMAYFTVVALSFTGIEVAAYYIQDTRDPKRVYPRATLICALTVVLIYMFGALAIAMIVPHHQIDLSGGMNQAMSAFFKHLDILWAIPAFSILNALGGLALMNIWLIGPSRGLLASALNDNLPKFTKYTNREGAPVSILLMQGVLGSVFISLYLFTESMNQFYWVFQTLAAQLLIMMYFLIFSSVIRLRYTQPHVERVYQIPGGKLGLWLVCGVGLGFCCVAFIFGFSLPNEYHFKSHGAYSVMMLSCCFIFCSVPFIWQRRQNRRLVELALPQI